MESRTLSEMGASSVGCSAEQRMTSPSSNLLTGSVSREMDTHVRASGATRSSSCAWPSLQEGQMIMHLSITCTSSNLIYSISLITVNQYRIVQWEFYIYLPDSLGADEPRDLGRRVTSGDDALKLDLLAG